MIVDEFALKLLKAGEPEFELPGPNDSEVFVTFEQWAVLRHMHKGARGWVNPGERTFKVTMEWYKK